MQLLIATTFLASLARLSSADQGAVKTTVFDLLTDLTRPGLKMHPIKGARERNFRSARVNLDVRVILHRSGDKMTLCYVDHHDNAYKWAQVRRMEVDSHASVMQIVELHETVRKIEVPAYVEAERQIPPKPRPAAGMPDDQLLSYGIPVEWLGGVREADEDGLLYIAGLLPKEAGEALFQIAAGETPKPALPVSGGADPFDLPDAMRRLRAVTGLSMRLPWDILRRMRLLCGGLSPRGLSRWLSSRLPGGLTSKN